MIILIFDLYSLIPSALFSFNLFYPCFNSIQGVFCQAILNSTAFLFDSEESIRDHRFF